MMRASERIFTGGADMRFHGDMGGVIPCWRRSRVFPPDGKPQPSRPEGIDEWHEAEFDEERQIREPLPLHSVVWLKTLVYAQRAKKAFLEVEYDFSYDDRELNFEPFVNGARAHQPATPLLLSSPLPGLWLQLRQGWNVLAIKLKGRQEHASEFRFSARVIERNGTVLGPEFFSLTNGPAPAVTPASAGVERTCRQEERVMPPHPGAKHRRDAHELTAERLSGFTPGIGAGIRSAGRFGFAKGDGMLDCSMPFLGMVAKPYLFGHPQYKKSIMWHFDLLPPGVPEKDQYTGERAWLVHQPGDKEQVEVNWLGVNWRKQLVAEADFHHRRSGRTIDFSCSYSVASPGILVETNDAALRLGGLESASSFDSIVLPLRAGRTIRPCHADVVYDRQRDGAFTDNWILLWGNNSFPDVPVMLALQRNPERIVFNHNEAQALDSVDIVASGEFGLAAVVFPFGFEVFKPEDTRGDAWLNAAVAKCDFFSKAVLAYPSACREHFKINRAEERIEIIQEFDHRIITDEWGSEPLRTAPLPPPLSLIEDVAQVKLDEASEDFGFPTKYGYLKGVVGRDWSSYSLPLPPTRRKFCLKPEGDNHAAALLGGDFDEYLRFHRSSDKIPNPGIYQFILPYAIPLLLFNFLKDEERGKLEEIVREGVSKGASPATEYTHTSGKRCHSWYKRTEPYTGVDYSSTYLHIGGIDSLASCGRESIETHQKVFDEIDWGNGLALYSLYLGALLSGDWQPIKENWKTVRHAFDYFLVLQDWACMATGCCESGITWNDGTNYGGYLGFVRMAELAGDEASFELGMYAFSKVAALRLASFRSTQRYFHRFWGVQPWWIAKFFNEETDAGMAFANKPELVGQFRLEGLYNMTTEGHYPEAWEWYGRMLPAEVKELLATIDSSCGDVFAPAADGSPSCYSSYGGTFGEQERFSYLMLSLFTGFHSPERLMALLEKAADNHLLSEQFLGMPFAHRRIPAKWAYCFLEAQIQAQAFPVWLTGWNGVRIETAEYSAARSVATLRFANGCEDGWIELGLSHEPTEVTADGREIPPGNVRHNGQLIKIQVGTAKTVQVFFNITSQGALP